MSTNFTTPGVYVQEIPLFPPSVAEVETAVPAFIGYTKQATKDTPDDLLLKPTKISSLKQFELYYGLPFKDELKIELTQDATTLEYTVQTLSVSALPDDTLVRTKYLLYYSLQAFFDNGGGDCYIVSVGKYDDANPTVTKDDLIKGLDAVRLEDEPTLLVIPEAVLLSVTDYGFVTTQMIKQCNDLGDRFAILDVYDGNKGPDDDLGGKKLVEANRDAWTGELKYAAAYYPFVRTSINYFIDEPGKEDKVTVKVGASEDPLKDLRGTDTARYNFVVKALRGYYVVLPPSGFVTGVYAATDTKRGVWKAPANVAVADVVEPVVKVDDGQQGLLNVDSTAGKSINALRFFAGKGTLVWGARTLAGNDNEWRYISVRRFFNMVEESVKKSTYWAVFEPNDANTWVKVRGMIENYLTQKWREGALAGATTKEAFFVRCGLGTTMNSQDILEGRMYVEIGMAVVRPAEFIILKFFHKLQTS
jgi:phage tail sheath protein FI